MKYLLLILKVNKGAVVVVVLSTLNLGVRITIMARCTHVLDTT